MAENNRKPIATYNGKPVGLFSVAKVELPTTFIVTDDTGNEAVGNYVGEEPIFTATANDIREGVVAATSDGITVGTKVIPSYNTSEGYKVISKGQEFKIDGLVGLNRYDYTKLQVIICPYAESIAKSVSAEKVVIDDNVYSVQSNEPIKSVEIDHENKTINFGIINESESLYLIRYFTYKEIY